VTTNHLTTGVELTVETSSITDLYQTMNNVQHNTGMHNESVIFTDI